MYRELHNKYISSTEMQSRYFVNQLSIYLVNTVFLNLSWFVNPFQRPFTNEKPTFVFKENIYKKQGHQQRSDRGPPQNAL